jgi:hypothetical protein
MVAVTVDEIGDQFTCIVANIGTYYFFILQSTSLSAAYYPKVFIGPVLCRLFIWPCLVLRASKRDHEDGRNEDKACHDDQDSHQYRAVSAAKASETGHRPQYYRAIMMIYSISSKEGYRSLHVAEVPMVNIKLSIFLIN